LTPHQCSAIFSEMSAALFIDTNQYLDLFGVGPAAKLFDSLDEQKAHLLVTTQIVDEVFRRKLGRAQEIFSAELKKIDISKKFAVAVDLLAVSDERTSELKEIFTRAEAGRAELAESAASALVRISRSEDYVSKRLAALFDGARSPTVEEMRRARERRERGNPPGKRADPLGDQITWEQLLAHCKEKKVNRIWIITKDQDFCAKHDEAILLNPFLHRDLVKACGAAPEIRCFSTLGAGIRDFEDNAGVKAEKRLTDTEAKAIDNATRALPASDLPTLSQDQYRHRLTAAMHAAVAAMLAEHPELRAIGTDPIE